MVSYKPAVLPPWPAEGEDVDPPLKGGSGVSHDSAALLDDGRMIYQYGFGDELYQCYYPSWTAFGKADNDSASTPFSISTHINGAGLSRPRSTVFRMADGELYMALITGISGSRYARIYKSTSGTGESAPGTSDWVLQSTIWTAGGFNTSEWDPASIGRAFAIGDRWIMSVARGFEFFGVPVFHQAIYSSEAGAAGPWTLRHDIGYHIFGATYGYGQCRQFADLGGTIIWGSTGNVNAAQCAYSTDGTAWTAFSVNDNSTVSDPLFAAGGLLYRLYSSSTASGGWPNSGFSPYVLETTDATTPSANFILNLNPLVNDGSGHTQQYAVEGPPGEYALIYRGKILALLGGGHWPVMKGPKWASG